MRKMLIMANFSRSLLPAQTRRQWTNMVFEESSPPSAHAHRKRRSAKSTPRRVESCRWQGASIAMASRVPISP